MNLKKNIPAKSHRGDLMKHVTQAPRRDLDACRVMWSVPDGSLVDALEKMGVHPDGRRGRVAL